MAAASKEVEERRLNVHVSPSGFPALVLNADFRPLSYYPLSLWSWQDAIKAVFLERVNIVANYDRAVHSPSFEMKLPSVVSLKTFVKPSTHPAFTRFNVFLRDRFSCQYCGDARRPHLRSSAAALARRPHDLGQRRRRLLALQSAQGQPDAGGSEDVAVADAVPADRASPAPQRPAVPAQLSARELARLSLLGHRTRSVSRHAFSALEFAMISKLHSRRSGRAILFAISAVLAVSSQASRQRNQRPVSAGPADPQLIEDLVAANRILADQGLLDGWGHVSVRHPRDPNRYSHVTLARARTGHRQRHPGIRSR